MDEHANPVGRTGNGARRSPSSGLMEGSSLMEQNEYVTPVVADLGSVAEVTLGKYAEDSQDEGRYFE